MVSSISAARPGAKDTSAPIGWKPAFGSITPAFTSQDRATVIRFLQVDVLPTEGHQLASAEA
jgi:hypothetical protein